MKKKNNVEENYITSRGLFYEGMLLCLLCAYCKKIVWVEGDSFFCECGARYFFGK